MVSHPCRENRQGWDARISASLFRQRLRAAAESRYRGRGYRRPSSRAYFFTLGLALMAAHPVLAWQLRPASSGSDRRHHSSYFFGGAMVSLAALATRNLTTVLALILMVSPVWGLRPRRALRSALTSLPMPGMVNSPFFLVSLTAVSASSSRPAAACLLVISSFSAM